MTDIETRFRELVARLHRDTAHLSSSSKRLSHPAYQAIIGMGEPAVPLLLAELRDQGGLWFHALKEITGQSPVSEEDRPYGKRCREVWLKWGVEQGLIVEDAWEAIK